METKSIYSNTAKVCYKDIDNCGVWVYVYVCARIRIYKIVI